MRRFIKFAVSPEDYDRLHAYINRGHYAIRMAELDFDNPENHNQAFDFAGANPKLEKLPEAKLSNVAAMLCKRGSFQAWVGAAIGNAESASTLLKARLGIASRKDLDRNAVAGARFEKMEEEYKQWLCKQS